jgi:hypothetical protein
MNMLKILILAVSLTLSACGGSDCPDVFTRTQIITDEGTHWIKCSEFTCPGYATQRRCWVE